MKKDWWITLLLVLLLLSGTALILYPSFSGYINTLHASKIVGDYSQSISSLEESRKDESFLAAAEYNASLLLKSVTYELPEDTARQYEALLNLNGDGIMGRIEIPDINCILPIYHGTEEDTLQIGVGHLEWSSLPVGGESTHCVLSGHRGLPSARLFTELDKLREGNCFYLVIGDRLLTYEVDLIRIVEPEDLSELQIVEGKDYCTLMTCTPYGVNSHRLLVRGHRVENAVSSESIRIGADAVRIEPIIVAPAALAPMLLVIMLWFSVTGKKKKKEKGKGGNSLEKP